MPHLLVTGKDGESWEFPLAEGRTLIGRSRQCQVTVKDSTLSSTHAAIEKVGDGYCIIDLESTNGIRLAGQKVSHHEMPPDVPFQLGRFTFTLRSTKDTKAAKGATGDTIPTKNPTKEMKDTNAGREPAAPACAPAAAVPAAPAAAVPGVPPPAPVPARPRAVSHERSKGSPAARAAVCLLLLCGIGFGLWKWNKLQHPADSQSKTAAATPAPPVPLPMPGAATTPAAPAAAQKEAEPREDVVADPNAMANEPVTPGGPSRSNPMGMGMGSSADDLSVIGLRGGDVIEGRVLDRNDSELSVEIPPQGEGKARQRHIPIEEVLQVNGEAVKVDLHKLFQVRLGEADAQDPESLWKIADWCERFRLADEKKQVFGRILAVAPDHEATHRAMGHTRFQGKWYSPEELKEKGLVDAHGRFKVNLDTRRNLRRIIVDLLGRAPMEEDFAQAMMEKPEETVARLVASKEHFAFWYEEELYYFMLLDANHPASKNLLELPTRLASGDEGIWDAVHEIVISQYFNARNPGNDTYATVVLEQLMGMTVQKHVDVLEKAKKMYDNYKEVLFTRSGSSQADLVQIIMDQPDAYRFFVKRQYDKLVGKPIDKDTLERDAKRLQEDQMTWNDIVKGWILSPAYQGSVGEMKKKTDQMFIRSLYVDLLKRLPTYQELRSMRNAMQALADPGPLRNVMAKVMVDSEQVAANPRSDVKAWIGDQYVKYLCREPSAKELEVLSSALDSKRATPKMVLHAILSSAEYQYY